jgi:hypothetical protein
MVRSNNIVRDSFDNEDVQNIIEREEDENGNRIIKCKICRVKFDNSDAFEGHIAAGHLSTSNPNEDTPSGIRHLANDPYTCEACGRGFRQKNNTILTGYNTKK